MLTHLRAASALACFALFSTITQAQVVPNLNAAFGSAATASSRDNLDFSGYGGTPAAGGITRGQPAPSGTWESPLSRIAVGSYITPLGIGAGVAVKITRSTNIRAGANFFSYNLSGTDDGATYSGNLHFRSWQAVVDWFPFHGNLHISPGVLFNNQNRVTAQGGIAGGTSFTLNDVNYYSSSADPVYGNGTIQFKSTAPMLTVGWGNWIPRREHKHLSFPFEVGFAHTGDAIINLNLKGSVCTDPTQLYCGQVATDPSVQANVTGQVQKLQKDLQVIRFYPIISTGVSYKF